MDGTKTLDGLRPLERTLDEGLRFARRMYLPRVLGLGVGTLAVGGGLWEAHAPLWAGVLLALNDFAWPHLAYRIARVAAIRIIGHEFGGTNSGSGPQLNRIEPEPRKSGSGTNRGSSEEVAPAKAGAELFLKIMGSHFRGNDLLLFF
jgi:MASE2 domain-containing protein